MFKRFKVNFLLTTTFVALTLVSCNEGSSVKSEDTVTTAKPQLITEISREELDSQSEATISLDLNETKAHGVETITCPRISDLAEALIVKHSNEIWGKEYCRGRSIATNQAIEVVLFTLEGQCWNKKDRPKGSCGNNYSRYMVGVLNGKPLGPIKMDNNRYFSAQTVAVSDKGIIVSGAFYQIGDGKCCPSKKGKRFYSYNAQGFEEINLETYEDSEQ